MDRKDARKGLKKFEDAVTAYYNQIKINNTLRQDYDATQIMLREIIDMRVFLGVFTKSLNEKLQMIKRTTKIKKTTQVKKEAKAKRLSNDIQQLQEEINQIKAPSKKQK